MSKHETPEAAARQQAAQDTQPEQDARHPSTMGGARPLRTQTCVVADPVSETSVATAADRRYATVLFDLDGTLLPMAIDSFMESYVPSVRTFFASKGLDADTVVQGLFEGTKAMMVHDGEHLNSDDFWAVFAPMVGRSREDLEKISHEYYAGPFSYLGDAIRPNLDMIEAVHEVKRRGYQVAVATMPIFPQEAIVERLRWAGLSADEFAFVTAWDTCTALKPSTTYYTEVLHRAGAKPTETLMVGNNTLEDGNAMQLGCGFYLVTDYLIEREGGVQMDAVPHGSSKDLLEFVRQMPDLTQLS